jgi:hypothetical protein
MTTEERIDKMAELYRNVLRERGFDYADEIRMRDAYPDRPKYRLVFCTRSTHGVELMSYFACEYERELFDSHYELTFEIDWERQRRVCALAELRNEIHVLGLRHGSMSVRDIIHMRRPGTSESFSGLSTTRSSGTSSTLGASTERLDLASRQPRC